MHALQIAMHVAKANTEYKHPFLATARDRAARRRDRRHDRQGPLRRSQHEPAAPRPQPAQGVAGQGHRGRLLRDRQQGPGLSRAASAANVVVAGRAARRPPAPRQARSGRSRCCSTSTSTATIDEVHIFFTTFINTMKQESAARDTCCRSPRSTGRRARRSAHRRTPRRRSWDYLYEPDAKVLLDGVLRRYAEALVFQMVNENMASEQSARMVAMRAASGQRRRRSSTSCSSSTTRPGEAAITKELAEIVGGALRRRSSGDASTTLPT